MNINSACSPTAVHYIRPIIHHGPRAIPTARARAAYDPRRARCRGTTSEIGEQRDAGKMEEGTPSRERRSHLAPGLRERQDSKRRVELRGAGHIRTSA